MSIKFLNDFKLIISLKSFLLYYLDDSLDMSEEICFSHMLTLSSFNKTLSTFGMDTNECLQLSDDYISSFTSELGDELSLHFNDIFESNFDSGLSPLVKSHNINTYGIDIMTFEFNIPEIEILLPRIHVIDKDDFLDILEYIYNRDKHSKVFSFIETLHKEKFIECCQCSESSFMDMYMSLYYEKKSMKYIDILLHIGTQNMSFKSIMDNIFFNEAIGIGSNYSSINVCSILKLIVHLFCEKDRFYDYNVILFDPTCINISGSNYYMFPEA